MGRLELYELLTALPVGIMIAHVLRISSLAGKTRQEKSSFKRQRKLLKLRRAMLLHCILITAVGILGLIGDYVVLPDIRPWWYNAHYPIFTAAGPLLFLFELRRYRAFRREVAR